MYNGEQFPYTNYHDLNLDWIIKELKKIRNDEDSIAESAETATTARDEAVTARNEAVEAQEAATAIAETLQEISDTLLYNRLWGKQFAIYGDSYSASPRGALWQTVLNALTGTEAHVSAAGSLSLPQIYSTKWDSFEADIYIIEAGLNDVTLNTGAATFMDTIINFVNSIRNINPAAEIYFVTPPDIPDTTMHNYVYPTEFYRQCVWALQSRYKYGVVNGLKWQGLTYSDNVHPSNSTMPLLGKYIFQAIMNYGDEISFCNDYSKLKRNDTKLLLVMENGIPYLYPQNLVFDDVLSDGSAEIYLDATEMGVMNYKKPYTLKEVNDFYNGLIEVFGNPNTHISLRVAVEGKTTGDTITIPAGYSIEFIPNRWIKGF